MSTSVDLRQLAVRRDVSPARRRRPIFSRYLLPGAVLAGLVGVLVWAGWDSLVPAQPVTIVPVLATRAEVHSEGTPLFQAAGWVEPRPTPILVTALSEGVVDKLLVVEDQEVQAGEPVARLVSIDAELALKIAEAEVDLRQAELDGAKAVLTAAQTNLKIPATLQAALAEADAMLAQKESERAVLPAQLRAAKARLELAHISFENKKQLAPTGAVPELVYHQAKSEYETAAAAVDELQAKQPKIDREVEALSKKRDALRQRLDLKTEELRMFSEADAQVKIAGARLHHAEIDRDVAKLRLERMTVRAPVDGRVLALVAKPGTRLMGLAPNAGQEASTVVSLYNPNLLQIRADVRLEDVPRVQIGQKVRIETPAAPKGPLEGVVLYPTSLADPNKNTLQVKVHVKNPPPTVRPEMLVQVTFLAPPRQGGEKPSEKMRLLVPRHLVDASGGEAHLWLADQAAGVARKRSVKLGMAAGDLIEVVEGLGAADRLIVGGREGLRDGQRVTVTGEDAPPASTGRAPGDRPQRLPPPPKKKDH